MTTHRSPRFTFTTAISAISIAYAAYADTYLNLADQRQEIDGFGGCFIAYDQMPAYRDPMFYDLAAYDLGLTIIRAQFQDLAVVDADLEFDPVLVERTEYSRMIFKEFHKRGIETFLGTNWTAPAQYKTNQSLLHGGYLKPDARDTFAHWMVKNIRALEKRDGIKMSAISIQNELMFIEPYSSCLYSPIQLRETFRSVSKVFRDQNMDTMLVVPEDMGWYDRTRQYVDTLMRDEETSQFPSIFASHGWPGDENWKRMGTLVDQYDRKLWMTETSGHNQNWDGALAVAADIHKTLVHGNASGYIYWQINARDPDRSSLMTAGRHAPKSTAMKHFARYIRPGAKRIHAFASEEPLQTSAYFHPEDETLTVVLFNDSQNDATTQLDIAGAISRKARFHQYTSDAAHACRESIVSAKDTIEIPARSIVTLYGRLDGKLSRIVPLAPAGVVLDNDAPLVPVQAEKTTTQDERLHYAARANQPERVRELLKSGYDPDMPNVGGFSALHRSAWPGHVDVIDPLVDGGANPNPIDSNGETPLHIASSNGHSAYVRHLGSKGANIDFPDTLNGQTPLHNACRGGNLETARALIDSGANVNKADKHGWTALFLAAANHDPESNAISKLLLAHGADPKRTDKNRQTALHIAASNLHSSANGLPEVAAAKLAILVNAGAPVNQQDTLGRTALHYLCQIGHWGYREIAGQTPIIDQYTHSLQLLLELGANPEIKDKSGMKPIDYAAKEGYLDSVALLERNLESQASPNPSQNTELNKRLLQAVANQETDAIEALLESGADPNFKEKQGGTSLHGAVQNGNAALVRRLLQHGARNDIRDSDGFLPSERAQQSGRNDLLQILKGP